MPVFYPDNVQTNSPSINPIVLGLSNHIEGIGYFDAISGGTINRNDVTSSFRGTGFLAVVHDTTTVNDSELYVYAATNITDGAWTTTANWKSFTGASDTNLATTDLTQANSNRTYTIPNGRQLVFKGAGDEEFKIISNNINNANEIFLKAGKLTLSNAGAGSGNIKFLDGDESAGVTVSAPNIVDSEYSLILPPQAAGADRLIQSDSVGVLSYAQLSFTSNTLVIGAQSVDIGSAGTNTNLATDNLTQENEARSYDTNGNSLSFTNGGTSIFRVDGSGEFVAVMDGKVLRLNDDNNSDHVALTAPSSVSSTYTLTMPSAVATGDKLIQTDSSGNLSYAAVSFDSATDQLVIGAQSTDISGVDTNIGNADLTQSSAARTYTFSADSYLDFETSGSGSLRVQDSGGQMVAVVQGSESSHIGVSGGAGRTFAFTPNNSQSGNIILKAPPAYTEGGIWYNDSNQIKYATPSFDSATSQLVIGTNSTVISGTSSNLANSDLEQTSGQNREYLINSNSTNLTFATSDTNEAKIVLAQSTGNGQLTLQSGVLIDVKSGTGTVGGGFKIFGGSNNNSNFITLNAPANLSASTTFTLPNGPTATTKALEVDNTGTIAYAALSIATNTLSLGSQNVVLPSGGSGENLSTADLTQTDADRLYDVGNGTLSFEEAGASVFKIDTTGSDTFASPYFTKTRGFQTFEPQTSGAGLLLDLDTDYLTTGRFWGEIMELGAELATFSVGELVTFNGSNALTTAVNTDQTRSSGLMMMAVTSSATKRLMTRGYICLSKTLIVGIGADNNDAGAPLYVNSTAGDMTITVPGSGQYMRMVGHLILVNHSSGVVVVYFNPEGSVFKTV